jgi:manganese/zinc/iron transport system permease protein
VNIAEIIGTNNFMVLFGSILLTASTAVIGSFSYVRRQALIGDAIAHALLPGICLAFMWTGSKSPWVLVPGAILTGWLSVLCQETIVKYSKIKEDAALGIVLSVFFAFGIVLLTYIQQHGYASQSGLDKFLFGNAASLLLPDLLSFGLLALAVLLLVLAFYKEFLTYSFDPNFAETVGMSSTWLRLLLNGLTVVAVVIGIQAVGVVLMAAVLITPAAAARSWTHRLPTMILLAATFSGSSAIAGVSVSMLASGLPTGPLIVVVLSLIAVVSFLFAPQKGLISRNRRQQFHQRKINRENLLKLLYHHRSLGLKAIYEHRPMEERSIKKGLAELQQAQWVRQENKAYQLTEPGEKAARRIIKLHRLWEYYLSHKVHIAPDHVHEDAEMMEHILTPEMEALLEKELGFPEKDPHQSEIPYH